MQTQALALLPPSIRRLRMELYSTMVLGMLLVLGMGGNSFGTHVDPAREVAQLNRNSFPNGFVFGASASAYQYEGAWNQGGRGASIWDNFSHKYPGKIADGSNGDVAIDSYHRIQEDIGIMKDMGLDAYRFSISWSRILPKGNLGGGINEEGVRYYNNLINELVAKGIQPFVTLFHWDLPQALQDEYEGFLSPKVVDDFRDYVDVCFKEFGDRVKHWGTLNEPYTYAVHGYAQGVKAPGRCSAWQGLGCIGGDSGTEPYLVAHYQLLAHAAAVKLYKDKYQASQNGMIGLTLVSHWFIPYNNATHNRNAALRSLDFMLGWFLDPVTYGDYPRSMRTLVGNRLPKFTKEQSQLLRGSMDYLGLNYFTANYAHYARPPHNSHPSYLTDSWAKLKTERNGMPIGLPTGSDWLYICPIGIYDLLQYVKNKYNDPLVYVTGNGVAESNNSTLPLEQQLADPIRIDYYHYHLLHLRKAIDENKTKVKGYFAWSLFDNFEWNSGYSERFGINYVDYENGLKRLPKHSAAWFKTFLKK